jgi:hypothetical protein
VEVRVPQLIPKHLELVVIILYFLRSRLQVVVVVVAEARQPGLVQILPRMAAPEVVLVSVTLEIS